MPLEPSSVPDQEFQSTFTQVISVVTSVGTDTSSTVVVSDVPIVSASFEDPGITVETAPGQFTISGAYQSIIPITWYWKDLDDQLQKGTSVPAAGTYEKIVQVDSPASLTTVCNYTVVSSAGTDVFAHTVTLVSYNKIKTALVAALEGQPEPKE